MWHYALPLHTPTGVNYPVLATFSHWNAGSDWVPVGVKMHCTDGSLPDGMALLHLIFPNNGTNLIGDFYEDNTCWVLTPFRFDFADSLLPPPSQLYDRDGLVDSLTCMIVACSLLSAAIVATHFVWSRLDRRFASVSPVHKKWYVVANMSKCILLAIMCTSYKYWVAVYRSFALDRFINLEVKRTSVLYVATDAVALLLVPKLPTSTVVHHITTITLLAVHWGMDMTVKGWTGLIGVIKMMTVYGMFSTVSFTVNGYLALRVVYPKSTFTGLLCRVALVTYIICCIGNWSVHLLWFLHSIYNGSISLIMLLYGGCIGFIVHDDIVLIKWLIAKNSPVNNSKND